MTNRPALWQLKNPTPRHPLRRALDRRAQLERIDERQTKLDLEATRYN